VSNHIHGINLSYTSKVENVPMMTVNLMFLNVSKCPKVGGAFKFQRSIIINE
jgi:hypothetical protein